MLARSARRARLVLVLSVAPAGPIPAGTVLSEALGNWAGASNQGVSFAPNWSTRPTGSGF